MRSVPPEQEAATPDHSTFVAECWVPRLATSWGTYPSRRMQRTCSSSSSRGATSAAASRL